MVGSVKDFVADVQDKQGQMTVDVMSYKEKNKKNALFMVAVLNLLKEIVQKLINNEAARAEMLKKLEAALEEAQAAESSKAFWEKLRQGVLADVERQLKALNDKTAEKVSAKVEVLQQQLDNFFQQAQTASAVTARFEAEYPAIMNSIAAINADLDDVEEALEAPITEPEELITLSEQVADIRKNYTTAQERFEYWLKEFQEAARQLNAAAASVEDAASVGISAVIPGVAPHPAFAPAMVRPAIEISQSTMPRPVSRSMPTAMSAPKSSFVLDESTQELLASFGMPTDLFVSPQQKLEHIETELRTVGLRIGAAEQKIFSLAKQHPGLEIGNNPNGLASSPYIFLKDPNLSARKPRAFAGRTLRNEEEARLDALFRPLGLSRH